MPPVGGNYVFTMLNEDNTLYIAKGDNPLCLVHFRKLGVYVYTSTTAIMQKVVEGSFLQKYKFDMIEVSEGEIARIDKNGVLTKDTFEFMDEYERFPYFGRYRTAFNEDDGYLYDICNIFGIAPDDLDLLYEMGY